MHPVNLSEVHVVINTFGREVHYLERAISSILLQQYQPGAIHLIDQNDTPLILPHALKAEPLVHHHHAPDPSCSRARNLAVTLAPSGWIAFLDDDAHWQKDFSQHLCALMIRRPDVELIAGSVYDETSGQLYSLRQKVGGRLDRFSGSKLLTGANFLVRAKLFARVGGYDLRLGPGTSLPSSEEADLCWRLLATGAPALYAPEIAVLHPPMHVGDARLAARKAYRYGLGKGALAAIWLVEKHHVYGLLEFVEMTLIPLVNIIRGIFRRDWRQLRIQPAQWWGRQRSFWSMFFRHITRRSR